MISRLYYVCKVSLGSFSQYSLLNLYTQCINLGGSLPDFLFVNVSWQVLKSKFKFWTCRLWVFSPDFPDGGHYRLIAQVGRPVSVLVLLFQPIASFIFLLSHLGVSWFWMCCYWNWAFSYVVTESKTFSYLHCKPSTIIQLCSVTIVPHFRDICLRAYGSRSTGHFRKPLLVPTLIVLVPRDYDLSRLRIPCLKVSSVECFTWFF